MTRRLPLIALLLLLCALPLTAKKRPQSAPPLTDGSCREYPGLGVEPIALSKDVHLYLYQDAHYVWLCYDYPENSFGTLDMKLTTERLPETLNLHVSAQIGEYPADQPELGPQDPESDRWWNAQGWTANPVWTNGMDTTSEKPRYRFKNAEARELQLSKERFGKGTWRFTLNIRAIRGADGKFHELDFPEDGKPYTLRVF